MLELNSKHAFLFIHLIHLYWIFIYFSQTQGPESGAMKKAAIFFSWSFQCSLERKAGNLIYNCYIRVIQQSVYYNGSKYYSNDS